MRKSPVQPFSPQRVGVRSALARMALGLVCLTSFASCFSMFECANTVLFEVPSPQNKRVATVFERDCGATTAANNQVLIRKPDRKPDFDKGQTVLVYEGSKELRLEWLDDEHLKIWIPDGSKVFRKDGQSMGVEILYPEPKPASEKPAP